MSGIDIVNVANPLAPYNLSSIYAPSVGAIQGWFNNLALDGNLLIAVGFWNPNTIIQEYDISNPTNPVSIWNCTVASGNGANVFLQNGLAYVADDTGGLYIIRYPTSLPAPVMNPILPNPNPLGGLVYVNWSTVPLADNYTLYRATHPISVIDGSVTNVTTTAGTTATDTLTSAGMYYYAAMATNSSGNSPPAANVSVTIGMTPPSLSPITPSTSQTGNVTLNWNFVGGADNYSVYRYTSPITALNSSVSWVNTVTGISYADNNLPNGTYYYVVTANNILGNSSLSNNKQVTVAIPPVPAPIMNLILPNPNPLGGIVYVNWSAVNLATNYTLYRATHPISIIDGSLINVTTTTGTSVTDTLMTAGVYYYSAVATNDSGTSAPAANVSITIGMVAPILSPISPGTSTTGSITLNWTAVSGADNYTAYRFTALITTLNSSVACLGTVTSLSFMDTNLPDCVYFYAVTANNVLGNSTLSNNQQVTVAIPQTPSAPSLRTISPNPSSTGNIALSWNAISGASGYAVYRYSSFIIALNSSVSFLATVTTTSFNDNGLPNGTYYYVVIAYNSVGNSTVSNCQQVTVALAGNGQSPPNGSFVIIAVGVGVAAVIVVVIVVFSYRGRKSNTKAPEPAPFEWD
jgi:fibronectin type 3 domain-containing protein